MTVKELTVLFYTYAPFLVLLPCMLCLWHYFRSRSLLVKPLVFYFLLAIVVQAASFTMWLNRMNNLPLLHMYVPAEFIVLTWFFAAVSGRRLRGWRLYLVFFFLAFSLTESFFIGSVYNFNIFSRSLECILMIIYSISWYVTYLKEEHATAETKSLLYINSAFFIYFTGSVTLFALSRITEKYSFIPAVNIWSFHTFLLVLLYIVITIGLLKWMRA